MVRKLSLLYLLPQKYDRSALYSTTIRFGLKVKVDSYSLPPENRIKAYNLRRTARLTTGAHNPHKRIIFMKMKKQAEVGLLNFAERVRAESITT